jgi:hypothetical protein
LKVRRAFLTTRFELAAPGPAAALDAEAAEFAAWEQLDATDELLASPEVVD